MNNAFFMCDGKTFEHAVKQIQHAADGQHALFFEHGRKRLPFNKGHNDKIISLLFAYVVDVDNVGVVQLRNGPGFGQKKGHCFFVISQCRA